MRHLFLFIALFYWFSGNSQQSKAHSKFVWKKKIDITVNEVNFGNIKHLRSRYLTKNYGIGANKVIKADAYRRGIGMKVNFEKAFELYNEAIQTLNPSDKWYAESAARLGYMHYYGMVSGQQNITKAFEYLEMAAEHEVSSDHYKVMVGRCLYEGVSTYFKNWNKAETILETCQSADGWEILGRMHKDYDNLENFPSSWTKCKEYLTKAQFTIELENFKNDLSQPSEFERVIFHYPSFFNYPFSFKEVDMGNYPLMSTVLSELTQFKMEVDQKIGQQLLDKYNKTLEHFYKNKINSADKYEIIELVNQIGQHQISSVDLMGDAYKKFYRHVKSEQDTLVLHEMNDSLQYTNFRNEILNQLKTRRWELVEEAEDYFEYTEYIRKYPESVHMLEAQKWIERYDAQLSIYPYRDFYYEYCRTNKQRSYLLYKIIEKSNTDNTAFTPMVREFINTYLKFSSQTQKLSGKRGFLEGRHYTGTVYANEMIFKNTEYSYITIDNPSIILKQIFKGGYKHSFGSSMYSKVSNHRSFGDNDAVKFIEEDQLIIVDKTSREYGATKPVTISDVIAGTFIAIEAWNVIAYNTSACYSELGKKLNQNDKRIVNYTVKCKTKRDPLLIRYDPDAPHPYVVVDDKETSDHNNKEEAFKELCGCK